MPPPLMDCITDVITSIRFTEYQIKLKLKGGKDVTLWKRKFVCMWGGSKKFTDTVHQTLLREGGGDWCVPILTVGVEVSLIRDASNDIGRSSIYRILSLSLPDLEDTRRLKSYGSAVSTWLFAASRTLLGESDMRLVSQRVTGFVRKLVEGHEFSRHCEDDSDCDEEDEDEDYEDNKDDEMRSEGPLTAVCVMNMVGSLIRNAIKKINIRARLEKDLGDALSMSVPIVSATELDTLSVALKSYIRFRKNPFVAKMGGSKRPAFKTLDTFARAYGLPASMRSLAAVTYKLKTMLSDGGHACCDSAHLISHPLLDWTSEDVRQSIVEGLAEKRLISDGLGGDDIYLPYVHHIEQYVGARISVMCKGDGVDEWSRRITNESRHDHGGVSHLCRVRRVMQENDKCRQLDDVQKGVVSSILTGSQDMLVLSGFPGTGKSRVSQAVCEVCGFIGLKVLVCAPTAKAASRLGGGATTIHRALDAVPKKNGGGFMFKRDAMNPFDADLVLVDEASMLDMNIAYALLQACDQNRTRLMFVGDANQLPSVEWGDLLGSLIRSACVPCVFLDRVYRQVFGNNTIWPLAKSISEGGPVIRANIQSETVAWSSDDSFESVSTAIQALHSEYGDRMQIICPSKKHGLHTGKLNEVILRRNLGGQEKDTIFEVGDRVVVTKNQTPDASGMPTLMNGDCGRVARVNKVLGVTSRVWVQLDENKVIEGGDSGANVLDVSPEDLDHSYALTIHKAQGSEYEVVVIVMSSEQGQALNRQALYTGVSRAVKRLYIFSSRETLFECVSNISPPRSGHLEERICSVA